MSELYVHNPTADFAERKPLEYYPTDPRVIKAGFSFLPDAKLVQFNNIMECGAGENAPFLQEAFIKYPDAYRYDAVEIRDINTPQWILDVNATGNLDVMYFNKTHFIRDISEDDYEEKEKPDLIIGNPPFGDSWEQSERKNKKENRIIRKNCKEEGWSELEIDRHFPLYRSPKRPISEPRADAEAFLRHSMGLLQNGGFLMFLMRLGFYSGIQRAKGLFQEYRPYLINVITPRCSFNEDHKGTDATEYAFYYFQKGYNPTRAEIDFCMWKDLA